MQKKNFPSMRRFLPDKVTCASALSGLLLACAFPLPDYTPLAWFGLIPLVLVMQSRPFKSGFVAGMVFFAATLYWLNIVMTTYGHLPLAVSFLLYLLGPLFFFQTCWIFAWGHRGNHSV